MSLVPCSIHGEKIGGKLATEYAAWFDTSGERVSYQLKLCAPCLTQQMASLLAHRSDESSTLVLCPVCGTDSSESLDGLFLTIFPPKQDGKEYALTTCSSCAKAWRESFSANGKLMPNRYAKNNQDDQDWGAVLP